MESTPEIEHIIKTGIKSKNTTRKTRNTQHNSGNFLVLEVAGLFESNGSNTVLQIKPNIWCTKIYIQNTIIRVLPVLLYSGAAYKLRIKITYNWNNGAGM